jgi:hypothetical protein
MSDLGIFNNLITNVTGSLAEIWFIMSPEMSTESEQLNTNWWGRASTISLFIWFLYWFKNEPHSITGQILLWVPLGVIHLLAIRAVRRRYGWIYLAPLGLFWVIVIIALSGGIR